MATLKDLFVTYKTLPKQKLKLKALPEFNRWNYLLDLMEDIPAAKKLELEKKELQEKREVTIIPTYDNGVEEHPWTISGRTARTRAKQATNNDNYKKFLSLLDEYFLEHPEDEDYRDMLTNIAAMESSFNLKATNKHSSALGYFLFLDNTRKQYNNMSREEFANDSLAQISTAILHLKSLKDGVQRNVDSDTITKSNLTPLLIMYGMWWRPKSMYNYLYTGTDSFSTKDGMNIKKILEKAS